MSIQDMRDKSEGPGRQVHCWPDYRCLRSVWYGIHYNVPGTGSEGRNG